MCIKVSKRIIMALSWRKRCRSHICNFSPKPEQGAAPDCLRLKSLQSCERAVAGHGGFGLSRCGQGLRSEGRRHQGHQGMVIRLALNVAELLLERQHPAEASAEVGVFEPGLQNR